MQFDRAHPTQPLAVRYPAEGTYQLSFPYVTTTTNRLTLAAAKAFGSTLTSSYATAYVHYEGLPLRHGDGQRLARRGTAWPAPSRTCCHSRDPPAPCPPCTRGTSSALAPGFLR